MTESKDSGRVRQKRRDTANVDARAWWMVRSDKSVCSDGCGARCCKASFISLTPAEAEKLPGLAEQLGVPQPEIVPNERSRAGGPDGPVQEFILYAQPCVFLSKANLCQIYRDRPEHCKAFPDQTREWCPLSWKRFGSASY